MSGSSNREMTTDDGLPLGGEDDRACYRTDVPGRGYPQDITGIQVISKVEEEHC